MVNGVKKRSSVNSAENASMSNRTGGKDASGRSYTVENKSIWKGIGNATAGIFSLLLGIGTLPLTLTIACLPGVDGDRFMGGIQDTIGRFFNRAGEHFS